MPWYNLNMAHVDGSRLRLVMLPLRHVLRVHAPLYRACMQCWETVWDDLYQKHAFDQPLFLDQLFRQDEAACVFEGENCVAMILFRIVDFEIVDFRRDSYFREWTDLDLKLLLAHGTKVFMTTHLTVLTEYRKYHPDFSLKEVLLNLMIKRFLESEADVISGVTRRDRGIHDESYKLGARLVRENVAYMGNRWKVDLVAFYRKQAVESQNAVVRRLCDALWATKQDLTLDSETVASALTHSEGAGRGG